MVWRNTEIFARFQLKIDECRCDVKATQGRSTTWTIFMKLTEEWTVLIDYDRDDQDYMWFLETKRTSVNYWICSQQPSGFLCCTVWCLLPLWSWKPCPRFTPINGSTVRPFHCTARDDINKSYCCGFASLGKNSLRWAVSELIVLPQHTTNCLPGSSSIQYATTTRYKDDSVKGKQYCKPVIPSDSLSSQTQEQLIKPLQRTRLLAQSILCCSVKYPKQDVSETRYSLDSLKVSVHSLWAIYDEPEELQSISRTISFSLLLWSRATK